MEFEKLHAKLDEVLAFQRNLKGEINELKKQKLKKWSNENKNKPRDDYNKIHNKILKILVVKTFFTPLFLFKCSVSSIRLSISGGYKSLYPRFRFVTYEC